MIDESIMSAFRDGRYSRLNRCRWNQFLSMGIDLKGKTIFEPGAGIGDQTEWLLGQGVKSICVNDGGRITSKSLRSGLSVIGESDIFVLIWRINTTQYLFRMLI